MFLFLEESVNKQTFSRKTEGKLAYYKKMLYLCLLKRTLWKARYDYYIRRRPEGKG
jgi:hypothetical protein